MAPLRFLLPVGLYAVQMGHDYGMQLVLVELGDEVVPTLAAFLPLVSSLAAYSISILIAPKRTRGVATDPRAVAATGALLGIGSSRSIYALEFIDFRTRLVAKACKPAFVSASLAVAAFFGFRARAPSWPRAIAVGLGGALYGVGTALGPGTAITSVRGPLAIGFAVTAESAATAIQGHMLSAHCLSSAELMGEVNLWKIPFIMATSWAFADSAIRLTTSIIVSCALLAVLGALGQLLIFACVREFGAEHTASLGAARKALTYGVSSVAFGSAPVGGIRLAALAMVGAGLAMPARRGAERCRPAYMELPVRNIPV